MSENTTNINNNNEEQLSLDDGRRVKVLSPGMMVFNPSVKSLLMKNASISAWFSVIHSDTAAGMEVIWADF